jgi:hypothetical protein
VVRIAQKCGNNCEPGLAFVAGRKRSYAGGRAYRCVETAKYKEGSGVEVSRVAVVMQCPRRDSNTRPTVSETRAMSRTTPLSTAGSHLFRRRMRLKFANIDRATGRVSPVFFPVRFGTPSMSVASVELTAPAELYMT